MRARAVFTLSKSRRVVWRSRLKFVASLAWSFAGDELLHGASRPPSWTDTVRWFGGDRRVKAIVVQIDQGMVVE
jgi:hypothetical protein